MTEKPKLVYDDDCGFCTRSALYISRESEVALVPFSSVSPPLEDNLPENWQECAHLVTEDSIYSGGEAMVRAYELTDGRLSPFLGILRYIPGYEIVRDMIYDWITDHRPLVSRIL